MEERDLTPEQFQEWQKFKQKSEEFERLRNRCERALEAGSREVAEKLGISADQARQALIEIQQGYGSYVNLVKGVESAVKVQEDLNNLANKARDLADAMLKLGQGAWQVLNEPMENSTTYRDAEPFNLPDLNPANELHRGLTHPSMRQGAWVVRLAALEHLARTRESQVRTTIDGGGRTPFGWRLYGSPLDWLAQRCWDFVKDHGCSSQPVAIAVVQAILRAEGENPTKNAGEKAIRKAARTNPNGGDVKARS